MAAKVVITGGPSGGKTTLIEALQKEMGSVIGIAPEAASILYRGGFPRIKSPQAAIHGQKSIYFVQKELEGLALDQNKRAKLIICDRGSLDSIAYWPQTEFNFFTTLKTSMKKELQRYDWVIHLDTATRDYYDTTNALRTESYQEAVSLNERVKKAWAGHPRRLIISQNEDFLSKMTLSLSVIRAILEGHSWQRIQKEFLII